MDSENTTAARSGNGRDMKNLWYVSVASASTAAASRRMQDFALTRVAAPALLAAATMALACSGSTAAMSAGSAGPAGPASAGGAEKAGARDANLAGARCKGGAPCTCRNPAGSPAEDPPPDEAHKRFEIRLGATGGSAALDSPTLGHFTSGGDEACFYIDVL